MSTTPSTGMRARVPRGARWDCRSCARCCHLNDLGPVEPEIVQGLRDRDVASHWAPAAEGPWIEERRGPDGQSAFFLVHRDGHCVFLRDDGLCAIHGLFGAEAKPSFCREYPFHVVQDPKGLVVVVRADCGGLWESSADGTDLAEHVPALFALPQLRSVRRFAPEVVALWPGAGVSLDTFMAWEDEVLEAVDGTPPEPEAAVAAVRAVFARLTGVRLPEPSRARYHLALAALTEALHRSLERGLSTVPEGFDPHRLAFLRDNAASLRRVHARAHEPLPPLDDAGRAFLHHVLRATLLSKGFTAHGSVSAGLGASLLDACVARLAAPADAPVTVAALGAAHHPWKRLSIHPAVGQVLQLARPALVDLFLHAEG